MTEEAVALTVSYLGSGEAQESLERDPYWPKWDSPWWHMTLLWELGLASRIPGAIVRKMVQALDVHYLRFFPTAATGLPEGKDPYRHVPCHCALGTIYQVLAACGVPVDEELPWLRPWFLEYQLPDGGLNCDERAYMKPVPKSSIVSTLPPLEAILLCTSRSFTAQEGAFLDRGARYLMAHRLFRSATKSDRIINQGWLKPCFPRFYEYDILRGLRFLTRWSEIRGKPLASDAAAEGVQILRSRFPDGTINVERTVRDDEKTLALRADGQWSPGCSEPASSFDLLRQVGRTGEPSPVLTTFWEEVLAATRPWMPALSSDRAVLD